MKKKNFPSTLKKITNTKSDNQWVIPHVNFFILFSFYVRINFKVEAKHSKYQSYISPSIIPKLYT